MSTYERRLVPVPTTVVLLALRAKSVPGLRPDSDWPDLLSVSRCHRSGNFTGCRLLARTDFRFAGFNAQ
jgi:hypothetical protein